MSDLVSTCIISAFFEGVKEIQTDMPMNSVKLIFTSILLALFASGQVIAGENIDIKNAWIREAPPTLKVMAGYLDIENLSDQELILVAAESTAFERIEFHQSQIQNGIARMQPQEQIIIPANNRVSFTPGSFHLMLFNPHEPMREGKRVTIRLRFKQGGIHTFDTVIKRPHATTKHNHNNP